MKKIVWVGFLQGFFLTAQIQVLRHLARRRYKVSILTVDPKRTLSDAKDIHLMSIPLRYVPMVSNALYIVALFLIFPLFVLHSRPDYVILESLDGTVLSAISTLVLPRSIRPKIVLDIRSTPVELVGVVGRLKNFVFETSVRMSRDLFDGITIITPMMKRDVCDKFHIDPRFVGVWTSGVPTDLFRPERYIIRGAELRRTSGLDEKFVIVYHGALSHRRGIIETIHGIASLKDIYRNLVLFLLGSGPALLDLQRLIHEKGIQDRVVIHGPVEYERVPEYIAMCDVGIVPLPDIPDWRNQCPLKLLEYLAMEKAVIATDIPANREVIGDSKCGIYALSSEPREIARAILHAARNKEKISDWGSYGRKIVEDKYSYEKVAEDLESFLLRC